MDLASHKQFLEPAQVFNGSLAPARPEPSPAPGPALLLAAWSALQSGAIEAVDLSLSCGREIRNVVRLRLAGPIAQASTRRDGWTHMFPVDALTLIRFVARGGRRD